MTRAIVLAAMLPIAVAAQGDAKKTLAELQGTWVAVGASAQPMPAGAHSALVIAGDTYRGVSNGKVNERGTMKLDATTTPASLDLVIAEGSEAGKTQLAILEIAGDTMRIALAEPGSATRPTGFSDGLSLARLKPVAKEFEGSWEGTINPAAKPLKIVFKLANGPDGLATGTLVSVDQGGNEAPIAAVVIVGAHLKLIVPAVRGTYDGDLKDGQVIGTWSQGRGSTPLTLTRVPRTP